MSEDGMRQALVAAITQTGVVDPEKAGLLAAAVEGDFRTVIDQGGRLKLETRSGKPVEEELTRVLERPDMQIFRSVPMNAGEQMVAKINQQQSEARSRGGPRGPLGDYQFARSKFNR